MGDQHLAPSYCTFSMTVVYGWNEEKKRRAYEQRIIEVDMGLSPHLNVFSAKGDMKQAATVANNGILPGREGEQSYSRTLGWLWCVLDFSLIRAAIQCIRGARSASHRPIRLPTESTIVLPPEEH